MFKALTACPWQPPALFPLRLECCSCLPSTSDPSGRKCVDHRQAKMETGTDCLDCLSACPQPPLSDHQCYPFPNDWPSLSMQAGSDGQSYALELTFFKEINVEASKVSVTPRVRLHALSPKTRASVSVWAPTPKGHLSNPKKS